MAKLEMIGAEHVAKDVLVEVAGAKLGFVADFEAFVNWLA